MPLLTAVTFDFWSTIVDGRRNAERTALRIARLQRAISGAGHTCTSAEIAQAFHQALGRVSREARVTLRDVGPPGRWAAVATELGLSPEKIPFQVVERAYEDITLDPPPPTMPYVETALRELTRAGLRLAVICNTGMAGGQVLRQVLAHYGLLSYFQVTIWSNEFGWSKPDPRIFQHALDQLGAVQPHRALHVGDLEELDVRGAKRAGMHAARYVPEAQSALETAADLLVSDWRQLADQLVHAGYLRAEMRITDLPAGPQGRGGRATPRGS